MTIATLPPLPVLNGKEKLSPRTGEPPRPWNVAAALVSGCLAAAATAVTYGHHWWRAAHPETYLNSARLISWVNPAPGKWLSLTLEGVLAILAFLVAAAPPWAAFQGWNGWRISRIGTLVALGLTGLGTLLFSNLGFVAVALTLVSSTLLWLPATAKFCDAFDNHRSVTRKTWRRPQNIVYGRLPRYR